jgi:Ca-activated chloride channel homolog
MGFEAAWFWIALPPLLMWVWWFGRRGYAQLRPGARWASMAIRFVILACLVGALARPAWVSGSDRQHILFLLDVSPSVGEDNRQAALREIDRLAREAQDGGHEMSVIAFGRRPRMLMNARREWPGWTDTDRDLILFQSSLPALHARRPRLITENASRQEQEDLARRIADVEEFRGSIAGEITDLPSVMRLALNTSAVGAARTIYLFTDANFNRGDWQEAFRAAGRAGATVQTVALDLPIPPEVAAADLILPATVRINQGFSADLHVASTIETSASIVIYKDGYAAAQTNASLRRGDNVIKIPGLYLRDKGFHFINVAVRAAQDTNLENNLVKSLVVVPGALRVLYVDADETQQSYLKSALELEGMQVEARPAAGVPQALPDLLGFDAFILCNVPADRLTQRQMQMIKTYVQDFGGGFLMLGGENSFGLGGYYNTPIEEILPVKMPIQKDLMRPSLALLLVIDKSGSMEGVKIQLAKRAAVATAEAINPRDQIGVVGFDGQSRMVLELTAAGDRATIAASIAGLDAGGGTFLQPALEDAHQRLQQSNARRKHIIILSDGQTQGFGYPDMAQMMAADGISISTVGIGEGADMPLMEAIAAAGDGRAYFTNDFHSIPQIFTREALRASKSMLIERLVQPMVNEDDESIAELDAEELPPLTGYVATTPRETAKTVIISDAGDPILAKWRTGLGRSAAFTSEPKPRWAEDWIRWPDFAKFWTQLVRSIAGEDVGRNLSLEPDHQLEPDGVRLTVDVRDAAGNFITDRAVELTLHDQQAGPQKLTVTRQAPGLYSALVPQVAYGRSQQFAWHIPDPPREDAPATPQSRAPEAAQGSTVPYGYVYSYSPEFRALGVNQEALEQIQMRRFGNVTRIGDAAPLSLSTARSTERTPIWPALLVLAVLLAPLDIFMRRIG